MRLFGGATYFCHLSWGCDFFCHLFGGATFLSSLILYGDFCHLLRRRHFLPSFSARGFKTALLTNFVSKTACENQDHI